MRIREYIVLLGILAGTATAAAQPRHGRLDSLVRPEVRMRNQQFYDTIRARSDRNFFLRYFNRWFMVRRDTLAGDQVVDEAQRFVPYAGKTIAEIRIVPHNIYDTATTHRLQRLLNSVHYVTRERTIRRDLLFHSGDEVDPTILVRNQQLLRSRSYLYDADIEVALCPDDTTQVCIEVITADSWTISVDGSTGWSGKTSLELYDANILGLGNRFGVTTGFNWRHGGYGGNVFRYEMPNIAGTFFTGDVIVGRNFDRSDLGVSIDKEFILPRDYALGASYLDQTIPYYLLAQDSTYRMMYRQADFWVGKSLPLRTGASVFFTGRFYTRHYDRRIEVGEKLNPFFHNRKLYLTGLGIYREKFYTASLIHGYGFREYIATGHKIEANFGFEDAEFARSFYAGLSMAVGGFTRWGYFMGRFGVGAYRPTTGTEWVRGTLGFEFRYFTPLLIAGRSRVRQFFNLSFLRGWNRYAGSDEVLGFTDEYGPRGWRSRVTGINRSVLNTETVIFTPWQPFGFRMAFFAYADLALLGDNADIFSNRFLSTFGLGIRIRNEHLIFDAIQIRLGFAWGKSGFYHNDYFDIGNLKQTETYRYIPREPAEIDFR